MTVIKGIFSYLPKLENVIIIIPKGEFNSDEVFEIMEELSNFSRASTKALAFGQKRKSYNANIKNLELYNY